MIISRFEGIVFEIALQEFDKNGYGQEFLITDKPGARGYRYSIMPSSSLNPDNVSLVQEFQKLSEKQIQSYWSLPESHYPMFTDIDRNGECEVISFNETFQNEFKYPRWHVNPEVYSFDSILGQAKQNQKLNKDFIYTLWNDQTYKFNRIINHIKNSKSTSEFHQKMPEFDFGISATKFLHTAKQVKEFSVALNNLKTLLYEYNALIITGGFYDPPIFFHLNYGQPFSDFKKLNKKSFIFSDEELNQIRPIYQMLLKHNVSTS